MEGLIIRRTDVWLLCTLVETVSVVQIQRFRVRFTRCFLCGPFRIRYSTCSERNQAISSSQISLSCNSFCFVLSRVIPSIGSHKPTTLGASIAEESRILSVIQMSFGLVLGEPEQRQPCMWLPTWTCIIFQNHGMSCLKRKLQCSELHFSNKHKETNNHFVL